MSSGDDSEFQELISLADVEKELSILDRIGHIVSSDNEFMHAMVANQLRLAQVQQQLLTIERRENELLEGFQSPDVFVDIEQVDADIGEAVLADGVRNGLRNAHTGRVVNFPRDGTRWSFPAGDGVGNRHEVDLVSGEITITGPDLSQNMRGSLNEFDSAIARSGHLWVDSEITIILFDPSGDSTGRYQIDPGMSFPLGGIEAAEVHMDSPVPFDARLHFSPSLSPPIAPGTAPFHMIRFGYLQTDTGTSLQEVPFIGSGDSSQFGESNRASAVQNHGAARLNVTNMGQLHMIIENTDSQDAEIQLREWDDVDEQETASVDVHGTPDVASTNVESVPGNDFSVIETGLQTRYAKLMGQSASDGNQVTLRVQAFAQPNIR